MIIRVSKVLNKTDVSTTCAVVIVRVKVSCITSIDSIQLSLLTDWLIKSRYYWIICQLSRDVIGYEDSKCHRCVSICRLLSQFNSRLLLVEIVGCPVILS